MAMSLNTQEIVTFDNPPLDEVAIAAQLDELPEFNFETLAALHEAFRSNTESIEEHPPIGAQFELFDKAGKLRSGLQFSVSTNVLPPARRVWFVGHGGTDVIQVQNDRFVRNWRKRPDQPVYPRFESILPTFLDDFSIFQSVVEKRNGVKASVNQVDVSYYNNIVLPPETGYVEALGKYFKVFSPQSIDAGSVSDGFEPETATLKMSFRFFQDGPTSPRGRLHVEILSAVDSEDRRILRAQLTARGKPQNSELQSLKEFVCACRREIVTTFDVITSDLAHLEWKKR